MSEIKDYSGQLNELKDLVTKAIKQDKTGPLQEKINQHIRAIQKLTMTVGDLLKKQDSLLNDFPKEIKVKLLHRFEDKTKGFIFGSITLLILSTIMTGICVHLWNDNGKMKDNDVKFRMVRQMEPIVAYKTDTLYYLDPEGMEKKTKQLEAQQLAIAVAEAAVKSQAIKANRAKRNVEQLKKKKNGVKLIAFEKVSTY